MSNATKPADQWLDVMPAIPLAPRGVPLRLTTRPHVRRIGRDGYCGPVQLYDANGGDTAARFVYSAWRRGQAFPVDGKGPQDVRVRVLGMYIDGERERCIVPLSWLRVDLDDPQGFAYALRHLIKSEASRNVYETGHRMAEDLFIVRGDVTESDKFILATALAQATT